MSGRLEQIWLKRAHYGPMDPVSRAVLVEGKGVRDSANYGSAREVTLISLERWLALTSELGVDVDPSARRADLLVSGVDLEQSRGRFLKIGECLLEIAGEVRPCERMDAACRGLRDVMSPHWGGGAWGHVIRTGEIRLADPVAWDAELFADDIVRT